MTAIDKTWVYMGKTRYKDNGGLAYHIGFTTMGTGVIGKKAIYARKGKRAFVIGQIYSSQFDENGSAIGLDVAQMMVGHRWDRKDILEWEAISEREEAAERTKKMEADQGRISELERILAPLRASYTAMAKRGDWSGCAALEQAMLNNLRHHPRSYEK